MSNVDFTKAVLPVNPLQISRAARIALLNAEFEKACAAVTAGWPEDEIKTWTVQNDEARQWTAAAAEDKPATPLLTAMYQNRVSLGWTEPFEALVLRVIDNSDKYTAAIARLIAVRHVAERKITEATDPSAVTWSF